MGEWPGARCVKNSMGYLVLTGSEEKTSWKRSRRVGKLRFEFCEHLFAHGVAAGGGAGTDGGDEVLRTGAVVETHAANAGFDDALDGSAPAGVEGGDDALPAIGYQNRDAIGGLHGEQQAGLGGDLAVGAARGWAGRRRSGAGVDDKVGVELLEGEERSCGVAGDGFGQQAAVGEDGFAVVGRGEAEIQLAGRVFGAIGTAQTAFPGAESAAKPGKIPAGNGQPFDAVGGAAGDGEGRARVLRGRRGRIWTGWRDGVRGGCGVAGGAGCGPGLPAR